MKVVRLNRAGFAPIIIVVLLLVVGIGFFVSRQFLAGADQAGQAASQAASTTKNTKVASFDECAALADSTIKTGPATCITKDGRSFVRTATLNTSLQITPWRIKLPLTPVISDAFFIQHDGTMVRLSSDQLEIALASLQGCRAGFENLEYTRAKPGDLRADGKSFSKSDLEKLGSKVGEYYYYAVPQNSPACIPPADSLNEDAANLRAELQAAFKQAEAY